MQNKKEVISKRSFPDYLAPDEVKKTDAYGLEMARAIEFEWWFRSEGGQCNFLNKRDEYHNLRLYARGEQDTQVYKDLITGGDSDSYTNYDWRPLQIIPKFVKLLSNQMTERLFEVKAEATDKFSTDLKEDYKKRMQNLMDTLPIMKEAQKQLGVQVVPEGLEDLPDNQEELDLFMKLKYKPSIEIAAEEALKYTLDLNDYDEIQSRMIEDVVTIGVGALKHRTDPTKGIVVEWVDPADCVYSIPKHRNFKDSHYFGEVEKITINELKRVSNNKFSDEELTEIASSTTDWNKYHNAGSENQAAGGRLDGMMVNILHFTFKSTKTLSYKKKYNKNGGFKMTKRESTFEKGENDNSGFDVSKKVIDVWYEGSLVLGTEHIFNYKMCENMVRPKGNLNRTLPSYLFYAPDLYENRTKSKVGDVIPYVDQMQQIHIKLQQLIAKARPNGVFIDVDGLTEVPMGDGSFLSPLEVIKIYNETGNVLGTSKDAAGEYNHGKEPIRELKNGIVDGLDRLIMAYNHYLTLFRDAIGVPQGADASAPHPKMAVGVQENLANSSNIATRHILDSVLNITERLGEGLSLRLTDIFEYSDLKEVYINAIGRINVETLKALKKYHLHDLGIIIELKPDAQEKEFLENNIQVALSRELITLDDAIDIRSIHNIKLANALMKTRRVRREKDKKEQELRVIEANNEGQLKSTQAAAQSKQQEIQAMAQSAMSEINAKTQGRIAEIEAEKKAKLELMKEEFNYNMTLKGAETNLSNTQKKYDNDRKDSRQREKDTATSKIQEQKQFNKPALNFESAEDSISGSIGMEDIRIS
tara:strand:+ start:3454 stop:5895 length:2442 start_codon:yes stop_codon:yes gene_type:complete